jgi:hypothetical protein
VSDPAPIDTATPLTGAEVAAVCALGAPAWTIAVAYTLDRLGFSIAPFPILLLATLGTVATFVVFRRGAVWSTDELTAFIVIVLAAFTGLLWLAWPALLPIGRGPDLTHHLMLIDYIERHGHLVRDARLSGAMGEMIDYTPGSHLLAVLAGAWTGRDGLHAIHAMLAFSVALKAGFVFLIALRVLPKDSPRVPLAALAALLLFVPRVYAIDSFTRQSFFAQVVAELFAVGMWWSLTVWDERPARGPMAIFALSGAATMLTWPVWVGPPLAAFAVLIAVRGGISVRERIAQTVVGVGPIALAALAHAAGRAGAVVIAGTSGFVLRPSPEMFTWWLLVPGGVGLVLAAAQRRARVTTLIVAAIGLQAAALFVLATSRGADTPYLALKMCYLLPYPLAVAATLPIAMGWSRFGSSSRPALPWALVAMTGVLVLRPIVRAPRPAPVISPPLVDAGRWARNHLPPGCVDYLVADDDTAYWLHLAVLGNRRVSPRTQDEETFEPKKAIVRWIMPEGLPYAIVEDVSALPKDIRTNVDVVSRFGAAAVIRRRGQATCVEGP